MVGCLEPKAWEARDDGWTERGRESIDLVSDPNDPGALVRVARFRPYPHLSYRFVGCGGPGFADLDVLVYNGEGELIGRDDSRGRDPELTLPGDAADQFIVRLFAADLRQPTERAGVLLLAR